MSGAADPTATPTPVTATTPDAIGRYQVLATLGTGGAASVYLGRVVGIGGFERPVAIKMLHPHLRRDGAFVADFLREARLAARVRHPNVVSVEDVGESAEAVFLVMEHVDGVSLARLAELARAAGGRLDDAVVVRVMGDLLAGLHAAHELCDDDGRPLGVVHRDVSPHNVLVDRGGITRLADFGIAKPAIGGGHTASGTIKGKIPYMAPEQVRGRPLDRRADVWAAGITAWELFAGKNPHEGEQDVDALMRIASEPAPSLRPLRPELPAGVHAAIEKALAADPQDRWPTAAAFAEALRDGFRPRRPAEPGVVAAAVERLAGAELADRRKLLRDREPSVITAEPVAADGARSVAAATLAIALAGGAWWAMASRTRVAPEASAPRPAVVPAPAASPAPAEQPARPATSAPAATTAPKPPVRRAPPKRSPAPRPPKPSDPPMADNPYQ